MARIRLYSLIHFSHDGLIKANLFMGFPSNELNHGPNEFVSSINYPSIETFSEIVINFLTLASTAKIGITPYMG